MYFVLALLIFRIIDSALPPIANLSQSMCRLAANAYTNNLWPARALCHNL